VPVIVDQISEGLSFRDFFPGGKTADGERGASEAPISPPRSVRGAPRGRLELQSGWPCARACPVGCHAPEHPREASRLGGTLPPPRLFNLDVNPFNSFKSQRLHMYGLGLLASEPRPSECRMPPRTHGDKAPCCCVLRYVWEWRAPMQPAASSQQRTAQLRMRIQLHRPSALHMVHRDCFNCLCSS
jgi:hypothetical protein